MNNDTINLMEIMPEVESDGKKELPVIKIVGVGGGGGNAARHMYTMGITGVDYMIINTDKQALSSNPIPEKIQLGTGLGAGAKPEVAREAALESEERIRTALEGTKMVFITAGMGGGTGTGASPIVASIAKEMGILTIGIVTYPFHFEQKSKLRVADEGIRELGDNVDALIVIKNEALKSFYPDLKINNAFTKVDDVLLIAAKSIAEVITVESIINVDFNDVDTILRNSGTAIIGSGEAEGEDRAERAIEAAVNSPLLDTNTIHGARKVLFFLSYSHEYELSIEELGNITDMLENKTCSMEEMLIWGHGYDDSLGGKVRVTVIATDLQHRVPEFGYRSGHNQEPIGQIPNGQIPNEKMPNVSQPIVNQTPERPASERPLFPPTTLFPASENGTGKINAQFVQTPPAAPAPRIPTNEELRGKTEEEMTTYFSQTPYQRNKMMQEHRKEEVSNYQAVGNGTINFQASYLSNVAD
jgi:cell division protein FtsZ